MNSNPTANLQIDDNDEMFATFYFESYKSSKKSGKDSYKWRAVFPYRADSEKWRRKSFTLSIQTASGKLTQKLNGELSREAESIRQKLNAEVARTAIEARVPDNNADAPMTVSECVHLYIDSNVEIAKSTRSSYSGMLRRVIAPRIGDIPLSELTKSDCQKWANAIVKSYSRDTAANSLRLLKGALTYASDDEQDWCERNVAQSVKLPKPDVATRSIPNSLTHPERARLLSTVNAALTANEGIGYRDLPKMLSIKIALYTGMRRAEICALQWKNVDYASSSISIGQSIGNDGKRFYLKDPKTMSSIRTVECPAELMDDLKRREIAMKEQCVEAKVPFTRDMYVIGSIDGSWMKPARLDDNFRPFSKALNLKGTQDKPITFHCLRHTYATVLIQDMKVDVVTVAALLGHADPAMTLRRYASTGTDAKRGAADQLGQALKKCALQHSSAHRTIEFSKTGTDE